MIIYGTYYTETVGKRKCPDLTTPKEAWKNRQPLKKTPRKAGVNSPSLS